MPELPEVHTTVVGLNKTVKGKEIIDVWTDIAVETPTLPHHHHTTKSSVFFSQFKKAVIGATILNAERRGKNILIHLSNQHSIWIHLKMTGHLMYGTYVFNSKEKSWVPAPSEKNNALRDPYNKFLHTVFSLSSGKQLVFSDVRKFGKVTVISTKDIPEYFDTLGPEPLSASFTLKLCTARLMRRPTRPIKEVLLDQSVIAGIGNIYSDELLWLAGVHPLRPISSLTSTEYQKIYVAMKTVLKKGIDFGGDSTSDYRDINGERGKFQASHHAYRMTGKPCKKRGCTGIITRIAFGGRGAHFCPVHQT
jgi:formamidopyrimidine-DNA glycosylase